MKYGLLGIVFFLLLVSFVESDNIRIVTEDYPPYSYREGDSIVGISTDVVNNILQRAELNGKIYIMKWEDAYNFALTESNVLIYSIGRTEIRENLFKWVGEIVPSDVYIYALRSRGDVKISSISDLKKYKIGDLKENASFQWLKKAGIEEKNFIFAENQSDNFINLKDNIVDCVIVNEYVAKYTFDKMGEDPFLYKKIYFVKDISNILNLAFSINTDDEIVEACRRVLTEIKYDGTYKKILDKYLPE